MRGAVAALLLAGCTQHVQLDTQLAGLVSIQIAPPDTTLAITGLDEPPRMIAYTATGQFSNGTIRDVTDLVTWSVDNAAPGQVGADGTYTTSNAAAGHVTISAATQGIDATATLAVDVSATIVDATFPPPGDPSTLFPSGAQVVTGDPMHAPGVLYPSDGTMFPQGVSSTLVQYAPGMANDSFELTFDNDVLHLVVFTGAQRWAAEGSFWSLVEASGVGDAIQLAVAGTDSTGSGAIYASASVALDFSSDAPAGLIYYWSAATNGVMRGELGAPSAGKLYPSDTTCVGCHTVSRDASAMALGYGNEGNPVLATIALGDLSTVIDPSTALPTGWATYSPDASMILVSANGGLTLYDARSGAVLGPVTLPPPMMFATHPDWSPDGSAVAVALTAMKPNDKDVNGASIALLPFATGSFGAPQILVASTGMENNYFPRWSPDGAYLAYVHATSSSHNAMTAELRIVPATGGTPTVLGAASGVGLADTMPSWAPTQGQLSWLAFASTRPYGAVMPMAHVAQVWIAGIDLAQPGTGSDPSFAAFWLPCQDVTVLNNNPAWAAMPATLDLGNLRAARFNYR